LIHSHGKVVQIFSFLLLDVCQRIAPSHPEAAAAAAALMQIGTSKYLRRRGKSFLHFCIFCKQFYLNINDNHGYMMQLYGESCSMHLIAGVRRQKEASCGFFSLRRESINICLARLMSALRSTQRDLSASPAS
jgi:hypothetical protein